MSKENAMRRREFLQGAAALTAIATAVRPLRGAEVPSRTNVLFVLADQWRHHAFAHAGDPNVRTPNFDKLAAQGARFQRCYATNPVCTPNRSCIITGRFPHQTGMIHNNIMLPPENPCIAASFAAAGYATHYIGKWHMDGEAKPGFVPPGWRRRGFQTFEGFNRGHYYPTGANYFTNEGKVLRPDVYEPQYQTDLAIQFMTRQKAAGKPFFCYLSWGPPHMPYRPPAEWNKYAPEKLQWRPNVPDREKALAPTRNALAGYYGLCESLDYQLGRLMKSLEESGLAKDTLLVFSSDHGDMHGSHGLHYKSKPEDESLHIPLFMRLPGRIAEGQRPGMPISSVDLMPTVLSLCGVSVPKTVAGKDKSAAVLGGTTEHDSVYSMGAMEANRAVPSQNSPRVPMKKNAAKRAAAADDEEQSGTTEWRCMVTATHKLIVRHENANNGIFDVERDPYELNNLWAKPEAADLQTQLLARMKRWQTELEDPFPAKSKAAEKMYEKT
jgi:arylsulfatase A-like enzyme